MLLSRGQAAFKEASSAHQVATAKNVIYLYMSGGMSHLDTWDPQTNSDIAGPVKPIPTKADGIQISQYLPKLAQHTDKMTILRSLNSNVGAHEQGNYFMHTSYEQRSSIRHPSMGAWLTTFQGRSNPSLPGSVIIGTGSKHPCAGFFDAKVSHLAVNNPAQGLQNSRRHSGMNEADFDHRLNLSNKLDQHFRQTYQYQNVKAYSDIYKDAVRIMNSEDILAFDISKEPATAHAAYGTEAFGQGCLLARRLVEHGVRFVEVELGGWDSHNENFVRVEEQAIQLDQGMSALLTDLQERGMLEDTLVVLTTEFGRTPDINQNEGRDHYPKAFSSVLAGGGVRGGYVYGATDAGREIKEGKLSIPDFNATIAYSLGLPLNNVIFSPSKRPFTICDKGQPLVELFA
jgi:uncharacterized protein (DUF1501 family)